MLIRESFLAYHLFHTCIILFSLLFKKMTKKHRMSNGGLRNIIAGGANFTFLSWLYGKNLLLHCYEKCFKTWGSNIVISQYGLWDVLIFPVKVCRHLCFFLLCCKVIERNVWTCDIGACHRQHWFGCFFRVLCMLSRDLLLITPI